VCFLAAPSTAGCPPDHLSRRFNGVSMDPTSNRL